MVCPFGKIGLICLPDVIKTGVEWVSMDWPARQLSCPLLMRVQVQQPATSRRPSSGHGKLWRTPVFAVDTWGEMTIWVMSLSVPLS